VRTDYETIEVAADGYRKPTYYENRPDAGPVLFKVRKTYGGGGFTGQADAVIVLTDKPQKPLPAFGVPAEPALPPAPAGRLFDPEPALA
jgi:hypothetical protein